MNRAGPRAALITCGPPDRQQARGADPTSSRITREWLQLREIVKQIEAAEHPSLIDGAGRSWVWWKSDLYRHVATAACAGSCAGGADHGAFAWPLRLLPEPVTAAQGEAA